MFTKVYKVIVASSLQGIFEVNATFLKAYGGYLAAGRDIAGRLGYTADGGYT